MNSLKVKIIGLVTLTVVTIIAVATIVHFRQQSQMLTEVTERNLLLLSETIKNSIATAMRTGRSEEVLNILAHIKSQPSIKAIRIFDTEGKILGSADMREIGDQVGSEELAAFSSGKHIIRPAVGTEGNFIAASLIPNGPTCHGCHDSHQQILGVLSVTVSQSYLQSYLKDSRSHAYFSAVTLILLIMVAISVFLLFYVDRPIRELITVMNRVKNGDFDFHANVTSSTELRLLSENFNTMVEKLQENMHTALRHERELAEAQSKLAHHREIHLMNEQLGEKIRVIETLNLSLKERIEEIEEANYKIADLAGELEDKNSNLEKAVTRLSTLYKVGLGITSTMDRDKLFSLIVQSTMDTLRAQIGYMTLFDPASGTYAVTTLRGLELPSGRPTVVPLKPTSVSSWVIQQGKPLLIADIRETPQFNPISSLGFERRTLISAPLATKDEIIGTINLVNKVDGSVYSSDDLELLSTIATQASIAIKNSQLYDEQQRTYLNTIHALISTIEANDSYTRGHSERVTRYSLALGQKLGLPSERLKVIERAGILHDIGKIGINLNLLDKKEQLTAEDIRILQQHPAIGMKILEPIDFLHDVRLCIGQHHERYDGKGYPHSVPGNQLLIESRILAIADSFDAMISDRPYRAALPLEVAIRELDAHAGTQFDPHLVPLFVSLIQDGTLPCPVRSKISPHILAAPAQA